jgi:hypothetical protein
VTYTKEYLEQIHTYLTDMSNPPEFVNEYPEDAPMYRTVQESHQHPVVGIVFKYSHLPMGKALVLSPKDDSPRPQMDRSSSSEFDISDKYKWVSEITRLLKELDDV